MDTAKEFRISDLPTMRFGTKEDWFKTWIKKAAAEISKTVPIHVDAHAIFHTLIKSKTVRDKWFGDYPIPRETDMDLIEIAEVADLKPTAKRARR